MNRIEKLTQIFSQFPGIGPRQARRFVYFLLTKNVEILEELSKQIVDLKKEIRSCEKCKRFFDINQKRVRPEICSICDSNRDKSTLMIVQRDADLETIEKNGAFDGIYFVLGGSIPILEKEPEKIVRSKELIEYVQKLKKESGLREVIIATNWNPEGENTFDYVKKLLENALQQENKNIKISSLGKGLSMGTELEYTDKETMKNALRNRS